jgi:hypothetical protein
MSEIKFVYHVYSGLDAFEIRKNGEVIAYAPYIAVIATNEREAREKAARILDQQLEDQDTNPEYNNYVSDAILIYTFSYT